MVNQLLLLLFLLQETGRQCQHAAFCIEAARHVIFWSATTPEFNFV
jgi:ABC-type sulfate transport system permease subunit